MKHLFAGLVGFALVLGGCDLSQTVTAAPETGMQTLEDPRSPASVNLATGGLLTLRLDSNPSTGYYWTQTGGDDAVVTQLSDDYIADPAPEGIVGSGGTQVLVYKGVAPGTARVTLSYERSPEDVAETLILNVEVSG